MIWKTQYNAFMLLIFISYTGISFYFHNKDIFVGGIAYQLFFHILAVVVNFIFTLFGKPLFYDIKIF
jgi:hypothetical protein